MKKVNLLYIMLMFSILCTSCASVPDDVQEELDYREQIEQEEEDNDTSNDNTDTNLEYKTIEEIQNDIDSVLSKNYGVLSIKKVDDLSNISGCDEINITIKNSSIFEHKEDILNYFEDFPTTDDDWTYYEETQPTSEEDFISTGSPESFFYRKDNVEFGIDANGGISFHNDGTTYQGVYETLSIDDFDQIYRLSDGSECSFNDLEPYITQVMDNLSNALNITYNIRYCGVLYNPEDDDYHYIVDYVQTYNEIPFSTYVSLNSFNISAKENGIYQIYNYVTIEISKPNEILNSPNLIRYY